MSEDSPVRPTLRLAAARIAIVSSRYNAVFTTAMVDHATSELRALIDAPTISRHEVPGAFEIPLLVRAALEIGEVDAVLALGVILRGATDHADLIARSVTGALARLSLEFMKPVIHEVLLLDTEEQAQRRCVDPENNRGTEAARTAVLTLLALRELRASAVAPSSKGGS